MANKPITITIDEENLKIIDKGAKLDGRNRSNFMEKASIEKARDLEASENAY